MATDIKDAKTIVLVSIISVLVILGPIIYILSKPNIISKYIFSNSKLEPLLPVYNPPLSIPFIILSLYCGLAYGIYTGCTRITPTKQRPVIAGNVDKIFNQYSTPGDKNIRYIETTIKLGKEIGKVFNRPNHLTTEELQVYMDKYQKAYPKLDVNNEPILGIDGTRIMIKDKKIDLSEFQKIITEIQYDSSKHMILCIISLLLALSLIIPTLF